MLRNTTFNLPDELVSRVKAYAARHGTTMTAIVREHLQAIAGEYRQELMGTLQAYSEGRLSRADAIRELGLRGHVELLVALGDAGLPMPMPPAHEVDNQAVTFAKVWKEA